jgi:hypothetical protein
MLVEGERRKGRDYNDRQSVAFTLYELRQNDAGLPGLPEAYFSPFGHRQTEGGYCDVTDAFDAEGARLVSEISERRD